MAGYQAAVSRFVQGCEAALSRVVCVCVIKATTDPQFWTPRTTDLVVRGPGCCVTPLSV